MSFIPAGYFSIRLGAGFLSSSLFSLSLGNPFGLPCSLFCGLGVFFPFLRLCGLSIRRFFILTGCLGFCRSLFSLSLGNTFGLPCYLFCSLGVFFPFLRLCGLSIRHRFILTGISFGFLHFV